MMVENVIDSESDVSIGLITAPSVEIAKKPATKLWILAVACKSYSLN